MTATRALLWILTIAAAFGLGRFTADLQEQSEPATVASLREALADGNWLTRTRGLSAFLNELGPGNLPEALEVIEAKSQFLTDEELRLVMLAWSRFDAAAAFERALTWPRHSKRKASKAAIYAWAYRDPQNARVALRLVEDEAKLSAVLQNSLVAGWARGDDRAGVSEYVASMPAGTSRQKFTNTLAAELVEKGPEAVMEWAEAVPDDARQDYKRTVFDKAANAVAAVDPLRGARWIEGHLDSDFSAGAPILIVRRWVEAGNPVGAIEWAAGLEAGSVRNEAVNAAFSRWASTDQKEARAWLRTAAPAPGLDPAVRSVVRKVYQATPARAVDWAQRIHDPKIRSQVLIGVGQRWMRKDAEAAEAWLAESGLPEDMRSEILNPPPEEERQHRGRRGRRGRRPPRAGPRGGQR